MDDTHSDPECASSVPSRRARFLPLPLACASRSWTGDPAERRLGASGERVWMGGRAVWAGSSEFLFMRLSSLKD